MVEGDLPLVVAPVVPGHQIVGRVVRDGARFRAGDRMGIAWLRGTCGVCAFCIDRPRESVRAVARFTGWHADGGFADYATVPEAVRVRRCVPPSDDVEAAPLLCAGIIGYRALRLSAVAPAGASASMASDRPRA